MCDHFISQLVNQLVCYSVIQSKIRSARQRNSQSISQPTSHFSFSLFPSWNKPVLAVQVYAELKCNYSCLKNKQLGIWSEHNDTIAAVEIDTLKL